MSESSCHSSSNRDSPDASMDADIESESPEETNELSPIQIEESEEGQTETPQEQISDEMNANEGTPKPSETMKIPESIDTEESKDIASPSKRCHKETSSGPSKPRPISISKKKPREVISESDSYSTLGITLKKTTEILADLMSHMEGNLSVTREFEKIVKTLSQGKAKSVDIQPNQMDEDCDILENLTVSLRSSKVEASKRHLKRLGSCSTAKDSSISSKKTKKRREPSPVSQEQFEDQPGTSVRGPEDMIEPSKRRKGARSKVFRNKIQRTDAQYPREGTRRDLRLEIEIEARRKKWMNPVIDDDGGAGKPLDEQRKEIMETIVMAEFYRRSAEKLTDVVPWRHVVSSSEGSPEARFLSDSPPEYHFGDEFVDTSSQAAERQLFDYIQSLPSTSTGIYAAETGEEAPLPEVPFPETVSPDHDPVYEARQQALLQRIAEMQEISGILDWNILDLQSEDFYDYVERSTRDHGHPSWRTLMLTAYQLRRYHTIGSLNEARAWLTSYKVSEEDFFRVYHRVRLTWEKGYLEETSLAELIQRVMNCILGLGQMTFAMLFIDIGQKMRKEDEAWMRNEIRQDEEGTYAPIKRRLRRDKEDSKSSGSSDQLSRASMSDSSTNIGSEESFEALPRDGDSGDGMSDNVTSSENGSSTGNGTSSANEALEESVIPYAIKSSSSSEAPSESTESSISSSSLPSSSTNSDPARLDIPSEDCLSIDSAEMKYKPFTECVDVDPNIKFRKTSYLSRAESERTAAEEPRPSSILVPREELLEEQLMREQFQELEGVQLPSEEECLLHEEDSAPRRESGLPEPRGELLGEQLPRKQFQELEGIQQASEEECPLNKEDPTLQREPTLPVPSASTPLSPVTNTTERTPNLGGLITATTHVVIAEMVDTIANLILNDPTVESRDDVAQVRGGRDQIKRKDHEDSDDESSEKSDSKRFHPE